MSRVRDRKRGAITDHDVFMWRIRGDRGEVTGRQRHVSGSFGVHDPLRRSLETHGVEVGGEGGGIPSRCRGGVVVAIGRVGAVGERRG